MAEARAPDERDGDAPISVQAVPLGRSDDSKKSKPIRNGSSKLRMTSRDYANPYRPFPLGAVNAVGRKLNAVGLPRPMSVESIIRDAARAAGLSHCYTGSDQSYREGLEILVDSIETEADLNPLGRMITRGRLVGVLKARFRAESMWEADPSILDATLAQPLVITGLQRTGTTLLHRLIAADRRFRSLSSWEVLDPAPPRRTGGTDPRLKAARRAEKGAAWMSPDFFAVHPIDHKAPEEDVLLLDNTFRSTVAEAILRVPSYAAWLEKADSKPAYEFMRNLLLLFQRSEKRPYWILKTPHHLEFLDVLLEVFPEAKVVQGHRDPSKTMGSFLSMVAHGYGMFTDSPDPAEIGSHWKRKCLRMTDRGRLFRDSINPEIQKNTFLDVYFENLVGKPMEVLSKIHGFLGTEFDSAARQSAENLLDNHGRYRFGKHVYDLSDFGYSVKGIRKDFDEYRKRYGVPNEE